MQATGQSRTAENYPSRDAARVFVEGFIPKGPPEALRRLETGVKLAVFDRMGWQNMSSAVDNFRPLVFLIATGYDGQSNP
ncbi:hypothetical protein [Thermostilla marina]